MVTRFADTCNVWVLTRGRDGVCVDFGSGAVLDALDELGLDRITDVVVTHFHRDSTQGLARAAAAGIRVWVPPFERELFTDARGLWQARRLENTYEMRQEALALLDSVPIAGTVDEYRTRAYGGVELYALPTPGHTMGSVTYLAELDGRRVAFGGDLISAPGEVWSLAALQWSYTGVDGIAATILSTETLARRRPDLLLPAHGEPMEEPVAALRATQARLEELMELRRVEDPPFEWRRWLDEPWRAISPHLLENRTSISNSYALLSESGAALILDFGYDLWTGWPLGGARHQVRPLLSSIEALLREPAVDRVEALVTTHFHDDHVAGAELLRAVHGAEVWSPANVAPILEAPADHDLPCLWFDPIPVDRVLPLGEPVAWHEYELTAHPLPGHTRYAAAIEVEVDGRRVLATGDQQSREADGTGRLNYQYRNRFAIDDYAASAALYARLRPDVLLTGHWSEHEVTDRLLEQLARDGSRLAELHRELLPIDDAEGIFARLVPYRSEARPGGTVALALEVRNPFGHEATAAASLVVPDGWLVAPQRAELVLPPGGEGRIAFEVTVGASSGRTAVAAELTLGELRLGQHAEAVVTVA